MYYFGDWTFLLLLPALALSMYAQYKVKSTFERFSRERSASGMTGAQMARVLLDRNGLSNVPVSHISGSLTDHYDPRGKSLSLSDGVYDGSSVASLGVAAHEVGHAVQDARGYLPIRIHQAIVPLTRFGSMLAIPLFFIGILFGFGLLMDAGIILYALMVAYTTATLPVEFNASSRATEMLSSTGQIPPQEIAMSKQVLSAAALTYVASTAMAVMTLIRLLIIRGRR